MLFVPGKRKHVHETEGCWPSLKTSNFKSSGSDEYSLWHRQSPAGSTHFYVDLHMTAAGS